MGDGGSGGSAFPIAEEEILGILEAEGPLTGGELLAIRGGDRFVLWKACLSSSSLELARVGERYLRLDERVEGYSRLSPSILREFLTYTVIGTEASSVRAKAASMRARLREIGDWKMAVAAKAIQSVLARVSGAWGSFPEPCFVLGGDIAYGMAHSEPRPERSTGKMVKGSDLDIVAVLDDSVPEALFAILDEEIYREKYRLLMDPSINQEIDYVVKYVRKFREQLKFDSIKRMIACKIMKEGLLLEGDRGIFDRLKRLLAESGVEGRIAEMESMAIRNREEAEGMLREAAFMNEDFTTLFYSAQESEEFE